MRSLKESGNSNKRGQKKKESRNKRRILIGLSENLIGSAQRLRVMNHLTIKERTALTSGRRQSASKISSSWNNSKRGCSHSRARIRLCQNSESIAKRFKRCLETQTKGRVPNLTSNQRWQEQRLLNEFNIKNSWVSLKMKQKLNGSLNL